MLPFQLPFYKKYIDDIFTAIPMDQDQKIIEIFNSYHMKLKFTIENKNKYKLPFVLVERSVEGILETDWYHKPAFFERFLNFNSKHSVKLKINISQNLTHT